MFPMLFFPIVLLCGLFYFYKRSVGRSVIVSELTYDYIIVGGGAAGSIVAARLSNAGHTVLILERGGCVSWTNPIVSDPKNWKLVGTIPDLEWGNQSVPQIHMNNRVISIGRIKALGGSQIHNGMVYVRGGKEGFDEWAAEGCIGWDYDSVVPYFERVEDEIHIFHAEKNEFIMALIAACEENGIPYNEDYNLSEDQFGISSFQFLIDTNTQRETSFRSYIQLASPSNLTIRTDVLVNRALFDSNKKCIGVEYYDMAITSNVTYQVNVNKDVILSAGSIGTPQILILSGVGPSADLAELGIPLISDLPGVGSNLQDDLFVTAAFMSKQYVDPQPYGLLGAVIFWPSSLSSKKYADGISTDIESSMSSGEMIGMDLPDDQKQSYWLYPNVQKLQSRGTVKLQSDSIFDSPVIDPNYLANPDDLNRCIKALQDAINIGTANAMADWYDSQLQPPPDSTIEELREYVLSTADTCYHYAGTAKMGPGTDTMAVVSYETLEVYGVTGLRVVDASIIPTTVSGNTQGATMMIGEKASDIILTPLK